VLSHTNESCHTCVACCSVLCSVMCSVFQCAAVLRMSRVILVIHVADTHTHIFAPVYVYIHAHHVCNLCCSVLQRVAVCCSVLQCVL